MAEVSAIEWTDATWNPITGCTVISPGCRHCYAMKLAGTRLQHHPSREGLTVDTKAGPVWTGEVRFNEQWLEQPLRWRRPRRIFVCAHGDLFHEGVPDEWIDRIFAVMALAPHHTFQVLTKRADRMRRYFARYDAAHDHNAADFVADAVARYLGRIGAKGAARTAGSPFQWPLPNVWLGVSAETQHWLVQRAPHLLETPAAVRFISAEPLLGPLDLEPFILPVRQWSNAWANNYPLRYPTARLDWVIAGGESGQGARRLELGWARSLRDQCAAAGVPFFFKQWGHYLPAGQVAQQTGLWAPNSGQALYTTKRNAGRILDGRTHDGLPG